MAIYWSKNSIPALNNLPTKERTALIQPVVGSVWRRWQVWAPLLIQIILTFSFIFLAPQFQYRLPIVILFTLITARIAALPFNYFLALELEKLKTKNQ